uniref:Uncharacterized protein n=1 Tax=viral metagenome TaxID=1070528 RepID=A0A6H1ZV19_9ZZZZ
MCIITLPSCLYNKIRVCRQVTKKKFYARDGCYALMIMIGMFKNHRFMSIKFNL